MKYWMILPLLAVLAVGCATDSPDASKAERPDTTPERHDPHSFARKDEAVIQALDLELTVHFDRQVLEGVAHYQINTFADASTIRLDTRDLTIHQVTLDKGDETSFTLNEPTPHLGQELVIAITPQTESIHIHYSTAPHAAALQWLTPQQTAGKQHPFLFTQSQAILARSWIPIQDSPGIRFTYTATVKVPAGLMAVMSASNPQELNADGVYRFDMAQPIPSYLMALAVGAIRFGAVGPRTGVYAEPALLEASVYEFGDMENMLAQAESLYGAYAWDRYDVIVLPPSFPFGGMENPRLTFLTPTVIAGDRSLTALIAHELAHSWSGNLVTNENWNDFWLNEGFTVYFEGRIMEALYGASYANMLRQLGYQDLQEELVALKEAGHWEDTRLKLDLAGRDPDEGLTDIAYEKGALFLRHIESVVGRERFDTFLRNYFTTNAFQTMTTEAFIAYLNNNLIQENTAWADAIQLEEWIYGTGLPEDHPIVETDRFATVEAAITAWQNGQAPSKLATAEWTTHEWLHFLRNIPGTLTDTAMRDLDQAFGFTESGNAEIVAVWLVLAIKNDYTPAYERLETFLVEVGRRKFLSPIYRALAATDKGKERARAIYEKARPNYHAVSYQSIDAILNWEG